MTGHMRRFRKQWIKKCRSSMAQKILQRSWHAEITSPISRWYILVFAKQEVKLQQMSCLKCFSLWLNSSFIDVKPWKVTTKATLSILTIFARLSLYNYRHDPSTSFGEIGDRKYCNLNGFKCQGKAKSSWVLVFLKNSYLIYILCDTTNSMT